MAPILSILVVSYNTRAMTLACLDSIVSETQDTPYEIIIVDNASTDGSAAAAAGHKAGPKVIALDRNVGFAEGNNIAAREASGELVLLLNPDTLVLDGAIDKLVAFAKARAEAQIWGGRTVFPDGSLNRSCAWARMTPWRLFCRASGLAALAPNTTLFNGEVMGGWRRDSERQVDIVSGCFLLTTRKLWRRLGGFDPVFFMYGEEADFCLRAHVLGARPRCTPAATIVHYGGASEATREAKMVKLLAAKATLIERHFPRWSRELGIALHAAWPASRWLALAAIARITRNETHGAAAAVWRAIWLRRAEWQRGWKAAAQSAAISASTPARGLSSAAGAP
ncbi:MAG: glycosyltransferase family 2 protein [Proteobacteria bacterium]|nr:glycosyltransferase family 2 protein [Pseudomonadota bacterium]